MILVRTNHPYLRVEHHTLGIRFIDPVTALEDHDYYTRRQKKFVAMEPNLKLLLKDLMKQVYDEIKHSHEEIMAHFDSYSDHIDKCISDFTAEGKQRDNRVTTLESTAVTFNTSFTEWNPEIKDFINSVKLEVTKLNSYFNHDAKESSAHKPGIITYRSAFERPLAESTADGPSGHHVDQYNRECGFGSVYTHTHDPVKGTMHPPPPPPPQTPFDSSVARDQFHSPSSFSAGTKLPLGKLPKMNFPKFEGENPKLWKSCCESYFEMYEVDTSIWVKVASMHFEGPVLGGYSQWNRVRTANWSELCSWIHDRLGRDQHELLVR
jgi:hypothetical protein